MLGFWILSLALLVAGTAAADRLWTALDGDAARAQTTTAERMTAGAVLGLAFWLGINWILALTHTLTRATLLAAAIVLVLAAVLVSIRKRVPLRPAASWLIAVIPVVAWVAYILWRGAVLPPDSHDALSYHLPKAVFITQAHGYEYFAAPDSRINRLPANYELLLADVLLMTGSDQVTEWISAAMYLLFVLSAAAIAERWWGRGVHVAAVVMLTACAPLLLLQSGADKNDLMACWLATAALLWGARWAVRGGAMPWLLLILAIVLGAGTKPQQAAIPLAMTPAIVIRLFRHGIPWKGILVTLLIGIAAFAVCGGMPYAFDLLHLHDPGASPLTGSSEQRAPLYGDWNNIWQFPLLLLIEPFCSDAYSVWVPWRGQRWYWPKYEHYFSSYGPLFTLAVVALPFCVRRCRNLGDDETRRERFVLSMTTAIAVLLILPLAFRPIGFFAGMGRYVAFAIPVVYGWTAAPAAMELARSRPAALTRLLALLALAFVVIAADLAVNDAFSPLAYARDAARHPTRRVWFERRRAGTALDRMAGPADVVAVDGGFDTWLYPAMGEHRTRKLEFIAPAPAPVVVPDDAQWVMVDRSWNVLWGHPAFRDFGEFRLYLGHGTPSTSDTRVIAALSRDPRFELVYYNRQINQAVFHRKGAP